MYYVGIKTDCSRERFESRTEPTETTHGARYLAVVGPFDTMAGADYMADHGRNNPHLQCVSDAERCAALEQAQA